MKNAMLPSNQNSLSQITYRYLNRVTSQMTKL